ncbi:MAG: zinc ribbon domain-containing protein [Rhodanobacteraceae bacterium]|nr:zinc ribbon domain-containing protein [Rhodanobacteraceae bacterium]
MPIYEFECLSCGKRFDRLQKLSDPDPTDCPSCGAPQVKRAITAAAFRLKGGGWYETDFKGDGDKKRNLVEPAGESKPSAETASSGSDAKPAPASEPAKPAAPAAPAGG